MPATVPEMVECYVNAQRKHQHWRQELQRTILKIRSISGDIQDLERNIKAEKIACSSLGILSGVTTVAGILGVPFTFGGSLGLTVVGTWTGLYSGALGILNSWITTSK